jgi:hypothetical protein
MQVQATLERGGLKCTMCLNFFDDPCTLQTCAHTFCKACIVQPLMEGGAKCPTCQVPARRYDLMPNASLKTVADFARKCVADNLSSLEGYVDAAPVV